MNKQSFEKYLNDPLSLSQVSLDRLEKVIADFPYCQVAHLLYVRNLYQQGSIHFDQKLRIAAAYAGSRLQLKRLIQNTPVNPKPREEDVHPRPSYSKPESEPVESYPETITDEGFEEEQLDLKASKGVNTEYVEKKKEENQGRSKKELIDRFIKEEPSISSSPKHQFFKPSDAAKRSLEEHDDLFSETLARIYLKQGNAERAKRIYQQLMLKFPEKSSYFATQLKKLEESD